jgi:hypothetical protein
VKLDQEETGDQVRAQHWLAREARSTTRGCCHERLAKYQREWRRELTVVREVRGLAIILKLISG